METYISILRGINVSGSRIIKMDALKKLCDDLNLKNVETYIQSGNLIYNFENTDCAKMSQMLKSAIANTMGLDVPVITLTLLELEKVIRLNPFIQENSIDPSCLHVTFLSDNPANENIASLATVAVKNEKYHIVNKAIYLYCPDGYGKTKLTNSFLENKLKLTATTRNLKTVNELFKMALRLGLSNFNKLYNN